jgi:hypothetical protein
LTASDRRIYAYEPDEEKQTFTQVPVQKHFPELEGRFPCVVTRLQMECIDGLKKRITLCGCEDGTLKAFIISDSSEGPADSVFFSPSSPISPGLRKKESLGEEEEGKETPPDTASESGDSASLMSSMNEDLDLGISVRRYTHHFDGMITAIEVYTDGFSVNAIVSSAQSPVYVYT